MLRYTLNSKTKTRSDANAPTTRALTNCPELVSTFATSSNAAVSKNDANTCAYNHGREHLDVSVSALEIVSIAPTMTICSASSSACHLGQAAEADTEAAGGVHGGKERAQQGLARERGSPDRWHPPRRQPHKQEETTPQKYSDLNEPI